MGGRGRIKVIFVFSMLLFCGSLIFIKDPQGEYIDPMYYHDERLFNSNVTFLGESALDQAGFSVSICGDVNNDGFDDIIVGAPGSDENGNDSGQVYLIFGNESGYVMDMNLSNSSASFHGEEPGDMLGTRVTGAGDVNGDGYDDILIGAQNNDHNGNASGKAYLIMGGEDDWKLDANVSNCTASYFGEMPDDYFGCSISGVGDVDDDGFDDFTIGALHNDHGGNNSGKAYLVYGKRTGWKKGQNASTCDASFYGYDDWKRLGRNVHGGGDLNGDGVDDMVMGAPSYPVKSGPLIQAGTVYVINGRTNGWVKSYRVSRAEYDLSLTGEDSFGHIGSQISYIGDINFDGYDDLIAAGVRSGATNGGQTYLVLGREKFRFRNRSFGDMNASFMGTTQEYSGSSISGNGDVNGDSIPDILIGAPRNMSKGRHTGAIYLIFPYMTYAPIDVSQLKIYSDPGYVREINWTPINSTVYVQVVGQDTNPLSRDRAMLEIDGGYTYDHILWLDEVGASSGIYRSELTVSWEETHGKNVRSHIGDTLELVSRESKGLTADLFIGVPINIQPRPNDVTIFEDELFSMELTSRGMNPVIGWDVTFDINDWLTWNSESNRLAGIPLNDDIGVFIVKITARDLYGFTETIDFSITVLNTPPEIMNESINTTLEDELYLIDYDSTDDPSGMTRWTLATNAAWLEIDPYYGILSGDPGNDDVGKYNVNITVNDGNGGKDWQRFTLEVMDVNDAPIIIGNDQMIAIEEELYQVDYDAADIDDPPIFNWSLITDADWLTLNRTSGILSGIPIQEDVGKYIVNITVEDTRGARNSREFDLIVTEVNDAPIWLEIPENIVLNVGDLYHFDVNASDPDPDDNLSFGIVSSPPSNISINIVTGEIQWIAGLEPFISDPYVLIVELSVSDGKTTVFHSFKIEVVPLPAPRIQLISPGDGERVSHRNVTLSWELSYMPQDQGGIRYAVYYSINEPSATSFLDFIVVHIVNGSTTCHLTDVSPGDIVQWTVIPRTEMTTGRCIDGIVTFRVNHPPSFLHLENITIEAGAELRVGLTVSDGDGDDLKYVIKSAPDELYLDKTMGFILWTTTRVDIGNHSITIQANDGIDTAEVTFIVEVLPPEVEVEPERDDPNLMWIILVLIVLFGISILVGSLIFFNKRKKQASGEMEQPGNDREEE